MEKHEKQTISKEQITEWKKAYGHIYKSTVDGETVIWRPLKRSEYVDIMVERDLDEDKEQEEKRKRFFERQEKITKMTVLFPENVNALIEEKAGFATIIAEEVFAHSGFDMAESVEL